MSLDSVPRFTTRPEIRGTFGVAASTHWLASQSAMRIMEGGGNAFDAAFAAAMVLQVVEPHMNGAAGDVPILVHQAGTEAPKVICGQGPAPKAASIDRFDEIGLEIIPGTGLLAAVVPGAFDAWMTLLRDYGTITFAQGMETAIGYAEKGYPIAHGAVETIRAVADIMREHWPSSAEIYLPGGEPPVAGSLHRNRRLAQTWKRLIGEAQAAGRDRISQIDAARSAFYEGFVAEAIDDFCRDRPHFDVTGRKNGGLLHGDDMAGWRAGVEDPIHLDFGRYRVYKPGPWSQGPVALQTMQLLKGFDLEAMDPGGPDFVHVLVECMKLAYADRETFYGDPDFINVPLETLLSDAYAEERRKLVGDRANLELRPGNIPGYGRAPDYAAAAERCPVDGLMAGFGGGEPTHGPSGGPKLHIGDTCHLDVVDAAGNMVSAMPSGGWLQSSPVIPELGFCLGTRLQMAWLDPSAPASLQPGKRPRTTLTPSMAARDGEAYVAYGSPGGDQQDQWQLQLFLRHAVFGMNLQEAIDAPTLHSEHMPSSFYPRHAFPGRIAMEGRFGEATIKALKERGHRVAVADDWSEGRLSACAKDGDILKAAANPRGMQGYAVGR